MEEEGLYNVPLNLAKKCMELTHYFIRLKGQIKDDAEEARMGNYKFTQNISVAGTRREVTA
jgi:hypothetical protein